MNAGKSQIKSGIVLNYTNQILGNLIPFLYTPIMLSLLGQSEYGLYKLAGGITSYLALSALGMGSAISRYLIKAQTQEGEENEEKMLGFFLIIFQMIALISLLIGIILAFNIHRWYDQSLSVEELHRMRILVIIMTCNTALGFSLSPYISVAFAHEKFIFIQSMNIAATCIGPMANLLVLYMGYASIGMATASMILGIVTRLIYYMYVRNKLNIRARYGGLPLGQLKEILVFSLWIFVGDVVIQLFNTTDVIILGLVPTIGTVGVAVYSIGIMFNTVILGLTSGVSNLTAPRINKMVFSGAGGGELTDFAIKVGRIQGYTICLLVSGFIVFGKAFIALYMKSTEEDYSDAYWVALLMIIPNVIPIVQSVCLNIVIARNQHRFRSLVYLGIAVLNVIGTWFLVHTDLGIIGASLMTGIALVMGQGFIMNWFYRNRTDIELERFWKEVVGVYTVPTIMMAAGLLIGRSVNFESIPIFIVGVIVYTVVFMLLNWCFSFNLYEKTLILSILKKVYNKKTKGNTKE